jgi:UDP-glucose 4-epimerase
MSKPIAVITGGAGFVGSHMVDLLVSKGFSVRAIDNLTGGREANLAGQANNPDVTLDARDIRALNENDTLFKDAQLVFHFAGIGDIVPSIEHPTEYMDVNVQGTVKVLEAARAARVKKLVYAASSSCYGLAQTPTSETNPIDLQYPYALSKYLGEMSVMHWHRVYGLPANAVRLFNAYGPRSRTSGAYGAVFGVFLRQKLANKPFTVVGDGTQRRDFIYVSDVVRGFYAAADTEVSGEAFNIAADNPQSINRLVELLGGEKTYVPKRPGEPDCTWGDISKARRMLGWAPETTFEQGVANVVRDIEYWRDAPLWDEKSITNATKSWFRYLGAADESTPKS